MISRFKPSITVFCPRSTPSRRVVTGDGTVNIAALQCAMYAAPPTCMMTKHEWCILFHPGTSAESLQELPTVVLASCVCLEIWAQSLGCVAEP